MFAPVMVAADTLHWVVAKGRAAPGRSLRQSVPDGGWGVQFGVTPLTGIAWPSDALVPRAPSLLWGTWLLDFLLSGGLSHALLARGIVHNARLLRTLVDFLRTAGAPFKDRVTALLHRLLCSPEYLLLTPQHLDFAAWGAERAVALLAAHGVPSALGGGDEAEAERALLQRTLALPLDVVARLRQLAVEQRALAERANVMFLPRPLQRLLEVVATADCAVKRARMQMAVLRATNRSIYPPAADEEGDEPMGTGVGAGAAGAGAGAAAGAGSSRASLALLMPLGCFNR